MFLNYIFHTKHAAITLLNVVAVEKFMELMMAGEVFINQSHSG